MFTGGGGGGGGQFQVFIGTWICQNQMNRLYNVS